MIDPTQKHTTLRGFSVGETLAANKWFQLLEIAVVFSPVLLVIFGFRVLNIREPMYLIAAVWAANVAMLALIGLGIHLRGETWESIGLSFKWGALSDVWWTVFRSIPIFVFAIGAFIAGTIVMANIAGIPEAADMTKYNYLKGNLAMLLASLAGVYFVSSFGEEVIYRGFLITRAGELFGGKTRTALIGSLVFSSIVFGFAHFEWGATGIVQTAFMGAALAVSFLIIKRRLWPLVLAHAYMDTLLLVQLYFA